MVDIPLFDGPTFREIVLIVGFIVAGAITLAVTLLTFIGYWVWRSCLCCQRRRRKKHFERRLGGGDDAGGQRIYRPVGADTNARALFELEEEERGKRVGKVKWVLIYIVLWTWIFFIGAGPLVWLVVMDYLPWWAGWLCSLAVLWVGWFFFFPAYCRPNKPTNIVDKSALRNSGYVLVDDDDDSTLMHSINPGPGAHGTDNDGFLPNRRRSRNPCRLAAHALRERARRVRRRPFVFAAGLLFWLVVTFSATFVFEGMCIGEYPISIDFRLVRQLQSSTCSEGAAPCHVYLTFPPGNMSSSILVHFHASGLASSCASTVYYDTRSRSNGTLADYRYKATGTHFKYETKDFTRYIHWVRIDTLEPDTVYFFRAGCGSGPELFSPEKRFLSAPGPDTKNFTFVTGGDMGTSEEAAMIERVAAQLDPNPRFVLLGGDLAYANAMPTCYRVWDKWFDMWEQNMITREGNYIPMVALVGNHETGGGSSLHQSVSDIPFFFRYFHMYPGDDHVKQEQRQRKQEKIRQQAIESADDEPRPTFVSEMSAAHDAASAQDADAQTPGENELAALPNVYLTNGWDTTYHHHFVGDYLFLTLDSGMFLDVQGAQTAWLHQLLESWNATHNQSVADNGTNRTRQGHIMAVYHVPMWPSDKDVDVWQRDMRKYWEPLFDAYHVAVGFENHSHRYGRATPLKAGKADPTGTLYLGGGSFGVTPSSNNCSSWMPGCTPGNPWYMVNVQQKRHLLFVTVSPDEISIEVIDEHGDTFDHASAR